MNLIVYYSYEGNTEALVNNMLNVIDADVLKLVPVKEKKTKSLLRFVWGMKSVISTPKLEEYNIDLSKYNNIIIASPCWFGSYSPPIKTFLLENEIKDKNIYLLVCHGGSLRNTFNDYEKALKGNNIVSKLDLVYPLKNDINLAKNKTNKWIKDNLI